MKTLLCVIMLLMLIWMVPGFAADVPRGLGHPKPGEKHWYDSNCCNQNDCEPLEPGAIIPRKDGYEVHYINYAGKEVRGFLKYGDSKIRLSKDDREHGCSGPAVGTLYCIYVQLGV